MENASAHVAPQARMGLSPPERTSCSKKIPFGLQNSSSIYREATTPKTPAKSGESLGSPIRHDQISNNLEILVTDQGKPNKGGNPNSLCPIIKPSQDWHDSQEELLYQEGLALPSPQEERSTEDPSREINMARFLEIEDEDDSMERVNLDDYNSDDYKQYLSDEDMLDDLEAARAKTPRV
jgi:hypothetical protein